MNKESLKLNEGGKIIVNLPPLSKTTSGWISNNNVVTLLISLEFLSTFFIDFIVIEFAVAD